LTCFIIVFGACALQNTPPTITPTVAATSAPPEWFLRWFENPACSPPCWETITPGITSVGDIYSIEQQYPQMHVVTKQKGDPTISKIYLSVPYDHVPAKLLLDKYGQPDYVRLYKCDSGVCETHVIYEKLGIVLNFAPPYTDYQQGWTVEISPESNIFEIYFIETGLDSYWYNFPPDPKAIDKWKGYGAYTQ
jgi:hypothetical protein